MRKREEQFAIFIIDNCSTIRKCAEVFGVSKSTVHNDLSKKLRTTNKFLYYQVCGLLRRNFAEKHIRGGCATRLKYFRLRSLKQGTIQS